MYFHDITLFPAFFILFGISLLTGMVCLYELVKNDNKENYYIGFFFGLSCISFFSAWISFL